MISKQEKLKYGDILREQTQIRQKQQKKKQQFNQKKANLSRNNRTYIHNQDQYHLSPTSQQNVSLQYHSIPVTYRNQTNNRPYQLMHQSKQYPFSKIYNDNDMFQMNNIVTDRPRNRQINQSLSYSSNIKKDKLTLQKDTIEMRDDPQRGRYNNNHSQEQQNFNNNKKYPIKKQIPYRQESVNSIQKQVELDFFKKGGRNLLKLQNANQIEINQKQKQKQQMQRILKQQVEQTQLRKKKQLQKRKQEEKLQQQKYNLYIQQEKKKMEEQQRKKKQKHEKVKQDNQKNWKLKQIQVIEAQNQKNSSIIKNNLVSNVQKPQIIEYQLSPEIEQKIKMNVKQQQKNTSPQKQIQIQQIKSKLTKLKSARQKKDDELEEVKDRIQKIREQFLSKDQLYKLQLQKIRLQAQKARFQRQKTDLQLQKIREELKKKIHEDNQKLNLTLFKNPPKENFYNPIPISMFPKSIQKPENARNPSLERNYESQKIRINSPINFNQTLESLSGQTLRIPTDLPTDKKLTMSNIRDYAIKSSDISFNGPQKKLQLKKQDISPFHKYENRQLDQIDKLISENQNNRDKDRWVNMSTINSQVTKEIQLLINNQKPNNLLVPPSLNLSNIRKRQYQQNKFDKKQRIFKNNLKALDLQKINVNNDNRLQYLKQIQNQLISQNRSKEQKRQHHHHINDPQLLRLDDLLHNK